jgi:hypothetical protein
LGGGGGGKILGPIKPGTGIDKNAYLVKKSAISKLGKNLCNIRGYIFFSYLIFIHWQQI